MGIENPQTIVLPEEIKKQIDTAKKQVAIFDAELVTLQKTILAKEYSIRELLKQENELSAKISELENSIKRGTEKKTDIDSNNQRLTKQNSILEERNTELEKQIKEKSLIFAGKDTEISAKESEIRVSFEKIEQKNKELDQKEDKIRGFIKEIKELIAKF